MRIFVSIHALHATSSSYGTLTVSCDLWFVRLEASDQNPPAAVGGVIHHTKQWIPRHAIGMGTTGRTQQRVTFGPIRTTAKPYQFSAHGDHAWRWFWQPWSTIVLFHFDFFTLVLFLLFGLWPSLCWTEFGFGPKNIQPKLSSFRYDGARHLERVDADVPGFPGCFQLDVGDRVRVVVGLVVDFVLEPNFFVFGQIHVNGFAPRVMMPYICPHDQT